MPILARGERLEGALNVRTREPRDFTEDEIELLLAIAAQVAQSIEHAKLYAEAQRRVHELEALARISEAVSESLYLEESLEAIVKTTMDALSATGAALVLEDGAIAWPEGDADAHAIRQPLRWRGRPDRRARRRPRDAVHRSTTASCSRRSRSRRRSRSSTGAPSCAACSPRRSTTASRTTSRPSPRCCACRRATPRAIDPRKALEDSVNRILAIAAVHEVLTEQRDEDVDLAELLGRLRAMLVQGVGAGREVEATLEPVSLAGPPRDGARARLLGAARQRARARRQARPGRAARATTARSCSRSPTTAPGIAEEPPKGTGLSIVRALVRDELRGTLELRAETARAPRSFPAG